MAYRLFYYAKVVIQYTLLRFMGVGSEATEDIDLRTELGKQRYKEIFGKPPRMDRAEGTKGQGGSNPAPRPPTALDYLLTEFNERGRRLLAGHLAMTCGAGGIQKAAAQTGLDPKTVRKGKEEIASRAHLPKHHVRVAGGGRKPKAQADPAYQPEIQAVIDEDLAGDPAGKKPNWLRKTLRWIKGKLHKKGVEVSVSTIRRSLKECHVSLKKNKKRESPQRHPDRDAQFQRITALRQEALASGRPHLSVDTKKKELIGNFKNDGSTWRKDPCKVLDHDFPSAADGKLVPYGIYDIAKNRAYMYCGTSAETAEFAADCITRWCEEVGQKNYPGLDTLLVFCDCGGANGYRSRKWKVDIQAKVADRFGVAVRVCHYPTGASKYNPIEHRVFSYISLNWWGEPLTSSEKALGYMRSTTTASGLKVEAVLVEKVYQKGLKVSNAEIRALNIEYDPVCPKWNYVIRPRTQARPPS